MKYICTLLIALLFLGCNSSSSNKQKNNTVSMEINKTYVLHEGDTIEKEDENSVVKISKNSKEEEFFVTLTEGSAHIIYQ